MKRVGLMLSAVVLACCVLSGPAHAAVEVEGDAYVGVFDKYLWRGFDLSGSLPVAQGGVDLSAKGFTLSYWTNVQLKSDGGEGFASGEGNETDLVLDYSFDLNDLVSVSVGNVYYMLDALDDTNELYLSVALNTILEPSLTVYCDWDEAEETGLFYTASVGHGVDLTEKTALSLGASVSYNQSSDYAVGDYDEFHNYELSAGIDYALSDQLTLSPSFLYSGPISDEAKETIDSEMTGGVTVSLTF